MIELEGVDKTRGSRVVLRDLSLTVHPGEIYGLVGPNGAGKTTAIMIVSGLLEPDTGRALVAGAPAGEARHRLGLVPQELAIYEQLTCRENLRLFADLYGVDRHRVRQRIDDVVMGLGLGEYADTVVAELSGGWRRRVNVGVAVMQLPDVLVLDEPTSGLDVDARYDLWALIDHLRSQDTAVLVTTHDLDEAERQCTRIGVLSHGTVIADGTMDVLRDRFPAACLAEVDGRSTSALHQAAAAHGWPVRDWNGRLTLCLPDRLEFDDLATALDGCGVTSLIIREVTLEHVYLELTHDAPTEAAVSAC